jgi:alpha-glucoside transport system substrate-binding protein
MSLMSPPFISEEWLSAAVQPELARHGHRRWHFHRFNGKSLVWYPKAWDAAGYEIPETWDELMALNQKSPMTATPPGASVSNPARHRLGGHRLDRRDDAAHHLAGELRCLGSRQLPFDSPEVKKAIETWSELWFNDAYVFGGRSVHRLHLLWRFPHAHV